MESVLHLPERKRMQTFAKNAPMPVVRRLPKYHKYLKELLEEGVTKISSKDLSIRMGSTASQIRQDLNYFGGFGQQGYGYNVAELISAIEEILSIHEVYRCIIIGAGNLGKAIRNYISNLDGNAKMLAMFDLDASKEHEKEGEVPVYHTSRLKEYMREHEVDVAILAVPKASGIQAAEEVIDGGIRAIWNFTTADIPKSEGIVIENVAINESFYVLTYLLSEKQQNKT